MSKEELQEIINSYKWIKVKRYEEPEYIDKDSYEDLRIHHEKETNFLINKCRRLAKELLKKHKET